MKLHARYSLNGMPWIETYAKRDYILQETMTIFWNFPDANNKLFGYHDENVFRYKDFLLLSNKDNHS